MSVVTRLQSKSLSKSQLLMKLYPTPRPAKSTINTATKACNNTRRVVVTSNTMILLTYSPDSSAAVVVAASEATASAEGQIWKCALPFL